MDILQIQHIIDRIELLGISSREGQQHWNDIKELLIHSSPIDPDQSMIDDLESEIHDLNMEIDDLKNQIETEEKENSRLKDIIHRSETILASA